MSTHLLSVGVTPYTTDASDSLHSSYASFNRKIIDIRKTKYYGNNKKTFILRNDFFMCPPFYSYKILDDYNKTHIEIKEIKYIYGDEMMDDVGYEQYHHISFCTNGKYEIHIQNLRTNKIQTYTFIISPLFIF